MDTSYSARRKYSWWSPQIVAQFEKTFEPTPQANVVAVLTPHAGYEFSGSVAYQTFARVDWHNVRRVCLLSTWHRPDSPRIVVPGFVALDQSDFRGLLLDTPFIDQLRLALGPQIVATSSSDFAQEHSWEMQLPILSSFARRFNIQLRVTPILVGPLTGADSLKVAQFLTRWYDVAPEQSLFAINSDLTHYGPDYGFQLPVNENAIGNIIRAKDERLLRRIAQGCPCRQLQPTTCYPRLCLYQGICFSVAAMVCGVNAIALWNCIRSLLPFRCRVRLPVMYTSSLSSGETDNNFVTYAGMAFVKN